MARHDYFIKVDQNFPEHPKTLKLSDKAFRHLVTMWCYCARNKTDGRVPLKVFNKTTVKVRQELLGPFATLHQNFNNFDATLMQDRDDSSSTSSQLSDDSYVEMHDYLEHQTSREQMEKTSQARKVAGSKGGRASVRAKQIAKGLVETPATKSQPEEEREEEVEVKRTTGVVLSTRDDAPRTPLAVPPRFHPDSNSLAWAKAHHPAVDVKAETQKFIDWHLAHGTTSYNWDASWRSWISKASEFAKTQPQPEKSMWDTLPKFQADPTNPDHAYLFEQLGTPVFGEGAGAKLFGDS